MVIKTTLKAFMAFCDLHRFENMLENSLLVRDLLASVFGAIVLSLTTMFIAGQARVRTPRLHEHHICVFIFVHLLRVPIALLV